MTMKTCIICEKSESEVKFAKYRKRCNKCNSKICNQKILERDPAYFRTKMKEHYDKNYKKEKINYINNL